MLDFLNDASLVLINKKLGYQPLNKSLVGSAFSGWRYYSSLEDQISSVVSGIIKNHAFQDGNKRTATLVYYRLCSLFNIKSLDEEQMFSAVVEIAKSKLSVEQVTKILFR